VAPTGECGSISPAFSFHAFAMFSETHFQRAAILT
jgi:hypothetical protein